MQLSDVAVRREMTYAHQTAYIGKGCVTNKSTRSDAFVAHAKGTTPFQCRRFSFGLRQEQSREKP